MELGMEDNTKDDVTSTACVVCNHLINSDRYVPVMTSNGPGLVHRDCYDTWVSWNR